MNIYICFSIVICKVIVVRMRGWSGSIDWEVHKLISWFQNEAQFYVHGLFVGLIYGIKHGGFCIQIDLDENLVLSYNSNICCGCG